MITIMRLKNAPRGELYAIERIDDLTPESAGKLSTSWWESRGTLSLIVIHDGVEDSRYVKEYADSARFPDEWPKGKAPPPKPEPLPDSVPKPPKPRPAPTLANPKQEKGKARPKCTGCGRSMPATPTFDEDCPWHSCQMCGVPHSCAMCMAPIPKSGKYEGDSDSTPSGRLANHRCLACGSPQHALSQRALWQMYTRRRK